jgi:predicted nucleic acid-binding protein
VARDSSEQQRAELDYYIDSNVILRVGQPNHGLHRDSLSFLSEHRRHLFVGPVVLDEVRFQITHCHWEYSRIGDIKHWLYVECQMLSLKDVAENIVALQAAYAEAGWYGNAGDTNDRFHAATATMCRLPRLATWEARFLQQQDWINEVNAERKLAPLQLVRPDWRLTNQ